MASELDRGFYAISDNALLLAFVPVIALTVGFFWGFKEREGF